ncbi:MAG: formylglycine-generating enzyme family protein [Flavobacteriales bacterium]
MKYSLNTLVLFILVFFCANSFAQKEKDYPNNVMLIKKSAAKLNETLYASKAEVTNKEYGYFLKSLKLNNKVEQLKKAGIDSMQWVGGFYNKPYVKHYHTHEAYDVYPVVNVSYEGATLYCKWLTEQYNVNPKRKFKIVIFRLPSEKEWTLAANGGNEKAIYPWEGDTLRAKNGSHRANYRAKVKTDSNSVNQNTNNGSLLAPVYAYWPNNYGIYNMSGNAAEMIQEKGVIKGGGFLNFEEQITIESKGDYDLNSTGSIAIGFRWFMEIIEG